MMPTYCYRCVSCNTTDTRLLTIADMEALEKCGPRHCRKKMVREYSTPRLSIFKAEFYEHIDPDGPVFIESKQQLYDECAKRDLYSSAVENSMGSGEVKRGRWI